MTKIILTFSFVFAVQTFGAITGTFVEGKVVNFDMKIVTIEIAGKKHTFNREKLGPKFKALKKGEIVEIDTATAASTQKNQFFAERDLGRNKKAGEIRPLNF